METRREWRENEGLSKSDKTKAKSIEKKRKVEKEEESGKKTRLGITRRGINVTMIFFFFCNEKAVDAMERKKKQEKKKKKKKTML